MADIMVTRLGFPYDLFWKPLFSQDRFQILVGLGFLTYRVTSNFPEAAFCILSLSMDIMAVLMMYMTPESGISILSLQMLISLNSIKIICIGYNILYLFLIVLAGALMFVRFGDLVSLVCALMPALLTYLGFLPSPFAVAYLLESVVCLPLLWRTIPNQFGQRKSICVLACHALGSLFVGRLFLAHHYLDIGLYRMFQGPWDLPVCFRGNDVFAICARSVGFLLHLLQAGFFIKFLLLYCPAFFSPSDFRMKDIGCRLQTPGACY